MLVMRDARVWNTEGTEEKKTKRQRCDHFG